VLLMLLRSNAFGQGDSYAVTDTDGNVYHTVTIGTQVWMVENLKTTKYRNGDPIPYDTSKRKHNTQGVYNNYNNDTNISSIYGRLYNWYAAHDDRKIAPLGWHVPQKSDWDKLIDHLTYLGDVNSVGGKLKESDTTHWKYPNTGATNRSGFTALPGGRYFFGAFESIGSKGFWWSSTGIINISAYYLRLINSQSEAQLIYYTKNMGLSIRCLKD